MKMKIKLIWGSVILLFSILLGGCGTTDSGEITEYKNSLNEFFEKVSVLNQDINAIDTSSPNYSSKLLALLDELNREFKEMSELDVPNGFTGVKELSEDAFLRISKAVSLYHEFFENEECDETLSNEAYNQYLMANKEIHYIIQILHGNSYEDVVKTTKTDSSDAEESTETEFEE